MAKKLIQVTTCDWCSGNSSVNNIPGMFRASDSDTSYGIPVCGQCGGLGIVVDDSDFAARAAQIMALRQDYCPSDFLRKPLFGTRAKALRRLMTVVREHYRVHGQGLRCFAKLIDDGLLEKIAQNYERDAHKMLQNFEQLNVPIDLPPDQEQVYLSFYQVIMRAVILGELEEAEQGFQGLLAAFPEFSSAWYEYATFVMWHRRNPRAAMAHFEKACSVQPQKVLHYMDAATCCAHVPEALPAMAEYLKLAKECPDFTGLQGHEQVLCELADAIAPDFAN
jgi:tetratricopeptide (TPR) repeat protein